jgi:predicted dehydrogenase
MYFSVRRFISDSDKMVFAQRCFGEKMNELNVGVVGCGEVANGHMRAWRRVKEAKISAVLDINASLAKKMAAKWRIPKYFTSLSEMMEKLPVNVIDICTPPSTHMPIAVEAMENEVNVVMEKPMTMTMRDAEAIVEAQKKSGVTAGVIHNWLFENTITKATSLIKEGQLGDILSVEIEAINTKDDFMASHENHWSHKYPGGRFGEMLAHPIYLIRHFLEGEETLEDIQVAKFGDYPWMKSDELTALFKVGKKVGRAYASFNAPRNSIYVSIYGKQAILKIDIINATVLKLDKRGGAAWDLGSDTVGQAFQIFGATVKNAGVRIAQRWLSGHDNYVRLFADSLLTGGPPPVSVEEGMKVVKSVEKACNLIEKAEIESEASLWHKKT